MSRLPSLFVVALPRSLSTLVYEQSCLALVLQQPLWTSGGEVLNVERFAIYGTGGLGLNYMTTKTYPERFDQTTAFLQHVVQPSGFAYKDVVQPFVMASWLRCPRAQLAVLKIASPVAHVASAMLARRWDYPRRAAHFRGDTVSQVIEGLVRAEQELERIPGESISFEELLESEHALAYALSRLYPGADITIPRYLTPGFIERRQQYRARRHCTAYRQIEERVAEMRALMFDAEGGGGAMSESVQQPTTCRNLFTMPGPRRATW